MTAQCIGVSWQTHGLAAVQRSPLPADSFSPRSAPAVGPQWHIGKLHQHRFWTAAL